MRKIQTRLWQILERPTEGDVAAKVCHGIIFVLIGTNVIASILGTVDWISQKWEWELYLFECFSVAIFTLEYAARIWSCTVEPRYASFLWGRIRFAVTPFALVDLVAILPFYLTVGVSDLRILRIFRLLRVFRIFKLARYTNAIQVLLGAVRDKREEISLAVIILLILILISASLIYFAEHEAQPDRFPDIPSAIWWAIVTLTTVGYGDIYPVTPLGKIIASFVAVLGIAMFALPAGILGAGFTEQLQKQRGPKNPRFCPHCGHPLD
mgnify:CR=1 FL=1